ncbi:AAA family ATPase [Helicobacter macacae]|uniref:Protein CR006 P-loop domain-containing protein n=1 Tax=Helicobacter macacae MIT 99-5501 TaxID=1357400 RepID=V8C6J4_9HELI|nr:AAA family ATPase [Helicobacter macacae]ETD23013.1 hypothetical protein HMPREF2086_01460 [Helicobacter macacae MIT 99-5501]
MINKFSKINYGSYQNFEWSDSLPEFKTLNILYGRNYAGKTTLSRILRSFEAKEPHHNYPNATFEIKFENNNTLNESNIKDEHKDLCIRVYNKDFVRENLSFLINDDAQGANIKAFSSIVVGKINIDIQTEIEKLKQQLGNQKDEEQNIEASGFYKELQDLENNKKEIERQIKDKNQDEQLREKAKSIKANPNFIKQGRNYDITIIKKDINETIKDENNIAQHIISQQKQDEYRNIIKDEPKNPINFKVLFNQNNFSQIVSGAKILIEKEIIAKEVIENDLRKWLEKGLELHQHDSEKCKFCESPLSKERIKWLIEHIKDDSSDKIDLENKLQDWLNNFESYKALDSNVVPIKDDVFYVQNKDKFNNLKENLANNIKCYNDELDKIKKSILSKQDNIFENLQLDTNSIKDYSQEIQKDLQSIQSLCNENDEKTKTLGEEQNKARECLRLNGVANFIKDIKYFETQAEIEKLKQSFNKYDENEKIVKSNIQKTKNEIEKLENSLSDEKAGADKANEYLKNFFGYNQLEFKSIPDRNGEFEIHRAGKPAKNLSEGECSLLAFCYFVAKLQDKDTEGKKPIIWIDDPISSLDNNHIFFVFSLIDSEIAKSKNYTQLFISTHNLEFLKYLKSLTGFELRGSETQWTPMFLIEKQHSSEIKKMPLHIRKYITEYNYLFEKILECAKFQTPNDITVDIYYGVANHIRKFLDYYLFFKYPNNESLMRKYEYFFGDYQKASFVNRIINELSHLEETTIRATVPLDLQEIQRVAQCVIKTIKAKDKEQFNALLESIGKSGGKDNV